MSNKISVKQDILFNSIPDQQLLYANQLSVNAWNNIINILRTQANINATYNKTLHNWLIGTTGTDITLPNDKSFVTYVLDDLKSLNITYNVLNNRVGTAEKQIMNNTKNIALLENKVDNIEVPEVKYTNSKATTTNIGGIEKGTTFYEKTISEMFDMLLYPYQAFSISTSTYPSYSLTTVKEYGESVTIYRVTINVTAGSLPIESIYIKDGSHNILAYADVNNPDSNVALPENLTSATLPITFTTSTGGNIIITVKDAKTTKTSTYSFKFVRPYYYGVTSSDNVNADVVTSLTKKISDKSSMSLKYSTYKQRAVFAYPASHGKLKTIKDANGFDVTDMFYLVNATVNGAMYMIYYTDKATADMTYSFTY